jgi:hypothetical protein
MFRLLLEIFDIVPPQKKSRLEPALRNGDELKRALRRREALEIRDFVSC